MNQHRTLNSEPRTLKHHALLTALQPVPALSAPDEAWHRGVDGLTQQLADVLERFYERRGYAVDHRQILLALANVQTLELAFAVDDGADWPALKAAADAIVQQQMADDALERQKGAARMN